jgi:hypothetical protein
LENLCLVSRQCFQIYVNLQPARNIAKVEELALAHVPMGSNSPGDSNILPFGKIVPNLTDRARHIEPTTEGIYFALNQLLKFLTTNR